MISHGENHQVRPHLGGEIIKLMTYSGGHGTRTRNPQAGAAFRMRLLAIRISSSARFPAKNIFTGVGDRGKTAHMGISAFRGVCSIGPDSPEVCTEEWRGECPQSRRRAGWIDASISLANRYAFVPGVPETY